MSLVDAARLNRQAEQLRRRPKPPSAEDVARFQERCQTAINQATARTAATPLASYPEQLPISTARQTILELLDTHQVVVVAGETGSGKTTQLPKMCLEAGLAQRGLIGHTQPRRIAARSVATRIAEELNTPLGEGVGYSVRFNDVTSAGTYIRVMTDGILLAEIQRDRLLLRYSALIIDEAHERSLNIDFLLGYLKQLLPQRPDLKIIITSATIDVTRFSEHFDDAPIVEVTGRTYPVEIRYRPPHIDDDGVDHITSITEAAAELCREGDGDILVFLSGEQEIRDTEDALRSVKDRFAGPPVEIVPLFARLSQADQHRVFTPHTGRRIVLSTNVAETSLTVPGIRYVIDTGMARISRYSHRLKVQRLPIEPISQASANQRSGRCGRVAAGICIRLYEESDFNDRPAFTDPEILRTNLASVMLSMAAIGLGDMGKFPFIQPPDRRQVQDGKQLLMELGALRANDGVDGTRGGRGGQPVLTAIGRTMAAFPVDPRTARMLVAAADTGCAQEVLTIVAAMTIQDPRERPLERRAAADQSHARFAVPESDFLSWLALWDYIKEQQDGLSSSAFRRMCKAEFFNYMRIREWQDLRGQLASLCRDLKLTTSSTGHHPDIIHQALLTGLLSHVGAYDQRSRDYHGARGARFAIFPGSAMGRTRPEFIMAGELVETSRLWARDVAAIKPEWVERAGAHVVKREHSAPRWSKKRQASVATERVTLYGVTILADKTVALAHINPELSRELFIRHALVAGEWDCRHEFFAHNQTLRQDAEELQLRTRRADLMVSDDELFAFYDERIPDHAVSGRHFDSWWKKAHRETPHLLHLSNDHLLTDAVADLDQTLFPTTWQVPGTNLELALTYQFNPGTDADGVTAHIPIALLNRVSDTGFDWQIPGLRAELITAYIKSLPKSIRRLLVPAPDTAAAISTLLTPDYKQPFAKALAECIYATKAVEVNATDFDTSRLPDRLVMNFRVERDGRTLAEGRSVEQLQRQLREDVAAAVAHATRRWEQAGLRAFPASGIPSAHDVRESTKDAAVQGFPALVEEHGELAVRVLADPVAQSKATLESVTSLIMQAMPQVIAQGFRNASNTDKLLLAGSPYPSTSELYQALQRSAVQTAVAQRPLPTTPEAFASTQREVTNEVANQRDQLCQQLLRCLQAGADLHIAWPKSTPLSLVGSMADAAAQRGLLFGPGFLERAGSHRLPDLTRYLTGLAYRMSRMAQDPHKDADRVGQVSDFERRISQLRRHAERDLAIATALTEATWQLQELRIHLFAQHIKTSGSISVQRMHKALASIERNCT